MDYDAEETKQDYENSDDEEDLRRFLRGGFGAKWENGISLYKIKNMRQFLPE